jgi:ribosomal protein L37AE/L43A
MADLIDGRHHTRKMAAMIERLRREYVPCARCKTRSASLPDGDRWVCGTCKPQWRADVHRAAGLSVAVARARLAQALKS